MFNFKVSLFTLSFLLAQSSWAVPVKILPLGDSITEGSNSGGNNLAYRDDLYNKLKYAGYTYGTDYEFVGTVHAAEDYDGVNLVNEGHAGFRADQVLSGLNGENSWLDSYDVDIALVHVGTNDIDQNKKGTELTTDAETLSEIEGIISDLKQKNSDMKIFIAKVLPYGDIDNEGVDGTKGLNSLLNTVWATDKVVTLVDQHTGFSSATDMQQTDFVHPNQIGEAKMADNWFEAIKSLLPTVTVATPPVTDMTLHLDASDVDGDGAHDVVSSGTAITTWNNKANNDVNHDVILVDGSTEPVQMTNSTGLNGKPVIDFTNSGLETTATGQIKTDKSYTKFVVYKLDNHGTANNLVASSPFATTLWTNNVQTIHALHDGDDGSIKTSNEVGIEHENYHRLAYRYGHGTALDNAIMLDGVTTGASNTTQAAHTSSNSKTSIGSIGSGNYLDGQIAEVIVYDRALTDAEINQVDAYLNAKWFGNVSVDPNLMLTSDPIATVGASYTITKTSNSSGPTTYSVAPADVCTRVGTAVTLKTAGICTITATQEAAPGFLADTAVPLQIIVSAAPIVPVDPGLTITSGATATVGASYTITKTSNSSGPTTYSVAPADVCTRVGTAVTLKTAGTCTITATQAASAGYLADTAIKTVAVSAADPAVDPTLEAVINIITGKSSKPITTEQLRAIGIKNVKSDIDYTKALKAYPYAVKGKPSVSEMQKAVDKANKDSLSTGSSGGGTTSTMLLFLLGLTSLLRRKGFSLRK